MSFTKTSDHDQQKTAQEKLHFMSDATAGLRNKTGQADEVQKVGKSHSQSHFLLWLPH